LTPTSLTFTGQAVGTTSASQTTTVRNTGTAPLTISSIAATGTNGPDYAATHNCPIAPATLLANSTCTVTVSFSPHAQGPSTASIAIVDDAAGSPHNVGLSGTGMSPAPGVSLTPMGLSFPSQLVGTQSAMETSALRNTGSAPLTITNVGLAGMNASDFTSSNDCPSSPATLAADATCTISVAFAPTATGNRVASVA